jgi:O-acetyl-ADP-ribose deacetylase (regulator of RNase III)
MESIQKKFTTSMGKANTFTLVKGDIATVPAQAMITSVNPGGAWWGAIDNLLDVACGAPKYTSDNQFHNQIHAFAGRRGGLRQGDVIVAKKQKPHTAKFEDVIFVVDEPSGPLRDVVYAALQAAGEAGYTSVSLPAIRCAVMLGVVEKDAQTAVGELLQGVTNYFADYPESSISNTIFVIYSSGEVFNLLQSSKLLK